MQSNKIIILGGGASIPFSSDLFKSEGSGLPPRLKSLIENNYSIGLNSWYKFGCQPTVNFVNDFVFYRKNYDTLRDLPLIIARHNPQLYNLPQYSLHENTLVLPDAKYYFGKESWDIHNKKCLSCGFKNHRALSSVKFCPKCRTKLMPIGFYHGHLAGIISTTIAIALGFTEIYLLGLDCNETNGKTHFYQDLVTDFKEYFGVGKVATTTGENYRTSAYSNPIKLNEEYYRPLQLDETVKIYNVSPNSALNNFVKISYDQFYEMNQAGNVNQEAARKEIRDTILEKTKEC